jgi:hypothetical protein
MTITISKKHLIIAISVLALIGISFVGHHFYSISQYEKNAKEFKARVTTLQVPMAYVLDDYQKNWRSAIFDHQAIDQIGVSTYCSDFSDAINWRMIANKTSIRFIETYFYDLERLMKKMDNPPSKYEKVQEKFMSIYNKMYKLKSQCKSPDGSLQSFTNEINSLYSDIKTEMNETDLTISVETSMLREYLEDYNRQFELVLKAGV